MRIMSSESMSSYRSAGAYGDDYDPDENPERRVHCSCGAFLPKKPTFEGGKMEVERDYGEFNPWTDEWGPCVQRDVEWLEPTTDCRKCGRIWSEAELWGFS